jgi:hypothetical protein
MMARRVRVRIALLALIASSLAADGFAHAQPVPFADPYDVPRAPRPPTLPELTHAEMEATLEETAGSILQPAGGGVTHAYVQRIALELPLSQRRWYVGAAYELAGANNGTGFEIVGGNLAFDGRTLWATTTGLGFGGGLSLMLPTASYDPNGPASHVALQAAMLRPWDVSYFVPNAYGIRPYVDVRAHDGPFVVQFRQGLDVTVSSLLLSDRRIFSTTGLYLGWQMAPKVALGLEAFEAYAIQLSDVRDGSRETLVVSPSVRLALPWVQPAISAFTNLGPPLSSPWVQRQSSTFTVPGDTGTVWGFRFAFTLVYDPTSSLLGLKGR